MPEEKLEAGTYIIDGDYNIINYNHVVGELYPHIKLGDKCYSAIASQSSPCAKCPLVTNNLLFYNPHQKVWVDASAAVLDYPGYGKCNSVHFFLHKSESMKETALTEELLTEIKRYISILQTETGKKCAYASYYVDGSPLLYVNSDMVSLLGYDSENELFEAANGIVENLMHPDERARTKAELAVSLNNENLSECLFRMPKKDGTWINSVHIGRLFTARNGRSLIVAVCDEITSFIEAHNDLQRQNKELIEREELSNAIINQIPGGYHRCAPEDGFPFIQIGSHFEKILGWTTEEIKEKFDNKYFNLIVDEDKYVADTYREMMKEIGKGNSYDTNVYRMKHKDGGFRWITDATMFVDLGDRSFFQGVIADITPYVVGIEAERRRAEESSHAKSDFLSQMSHDIRTPMNAIMGFAEFAMKADNLEVVQKEYLPKLQTAGSHLLMLINDVLEMSRIETRQIDGLVVLGDIAELTKEAVSVMRLQAEQKGLTMSYTENVKDSLVYTDDIRYNRVLMNLLSNAVKFTPHGGSVSVSLEQLPDPCEIPGEATYVLKISDTGIGMSADFVKKVFEPFERERSSTITGLEGTGLGMAIVKNILDAVGGTIDVESEQGKGTTFTVKVEFLRATEDEIAAYEPKNTVNASKMASPAEIKKLFSGKRVLLAEDNEFNILVAETILSEAGFSVDVAKDGKEAFEMVKMADVGYYDAVLMDIQMPIMNGYESSRAIRALGDERANVKIIAVTANAFESDKEAARLAGMNAHVSKPIVTRELYSVLMSLDTAGE